MVYNLISVGEFDITEKTDLNYVLNEESELIWGLLLNDFYCFSHGGLLPTH